MNTIHPINSVNFGYKHQLKTLFLKGKLPVKYGFYGDELTTKNATLEHLQCVCQGGKTELKNLVLASAAKNHERGNLPLKDFINWDAVNRYFLQFVNVKIKGFDGNQYIKMVKLTLANLLKGD